LREAAKRAQQWLDGADEALTARQAQLDEQLTQTQARLRKVQELTEKQSAAVRTQHAALQNRAREIGDAHAAKAQEQASELRKQLRSARRRWMRSGDFIELEQALKEATSGYASNTETTSRNSNDALLKAARAFDTTLTTLPRPRTQPHVEPLAPDERMERQANGRFRTLRRVLWRSWYLPGLEELMTSAINQDLAAQSEWVQGALQAAEKAAIGTREAKLAEIEKRGAGEVKRIKAESSFTENEAEFAALGRHLPIVRARRESATDINAQARALIEG
jgi:hypothetical protein